MVQRGSRHNCNGVSCCLGAVSLIPGLRERVISRAAFFPPRPPGYLVFHSHRNETIDESDGSLASRVYLLETKRDVSTNVVTRCLRPLPTAHISSDVISIRHVEVPAKRFKIHAFFCTRDDALFTVLFSHGNATDIGFMLPHFLDLCRVLCVNVVGYDFCGYGATPGKPSEKALYANLTAVFHWLTSNNGCNIPSHRIILYGQSVGSAPTLFLASKIPNLAGVVIHSGMKSAFTVLRRGYETIHWFDAFKNLERIKRVQSAVLLIHGTEDEEIDIEHAHALLVAAPKAQHWWAEGAGHNDIESRCRFEYFETLSSFIGSLQAGATTNVKV